MSTVFLASYIVLWVLVVVIFVGLFALYNHFGEMYLNSREGRADQGPGVDQAAPGATATDLRGIKVTVPEPSFPTLVVFTTTSCPLCADLVPTVQEFATRKEWLKTIVVCGDDRNAVAAWADGLSNVATVIPDPGRAIAAKYRVDATPFLVAVDQSGVVRTKGIINGETGLEFGARALMNGEVRREEEVRQ
jgi:methylamine dehydrogenase accessory protein MauD